MLNFLDAPASALLAATMGNRRDIDNGIKVKTCSLQTANGLLTTGTESFEFDDHGCNPKRSCLESCGLGGDFRGVGSRLTRTLESGRTGGCPAQHAAFEIGESDDRVVLGGMDAHTRLRDIALYFLAPHLRLCLRGFGWDEIGGGLLVVSHRRE